MKNFTARASRFFGLLLLSTFFVLPLKSQNLSLFSINADSLFVCGQDEQVVVLQNTGAAAATSVLLEIVLPMGLEYVVGTVSGGSENSISDLSKPVFSLADIAAGGSRILKIQVTATCAAIPTIDGGGLFFNQLKATFSGGTAAATSASFLVEKALPIFVSVAPASFSGKKGDMFNRTIRIQNTRFGKLEELRFVDQRLKKGLSAAASGGQVLQNLDSLFEARFDGSFFQNFGDGDQLFDKDEVIEIVEKVVIEDCALPSGNEIESVFRVFWGCDAGLDCAYDSTFAKVVIAPSPDAPSVVAKSLMRPPFDQCADEGNPQAIRLLNLGKIEAQNVSVEIVYSQANTAFSFGGFAAATVFEVKNSSGQTTTPVPFFQFPKLSCDDEFFQSASFSIPLLAAGDSVDIFFPVFSCSDSCVVVEISFDVNLFYQKPCGGFDSKKFELEQLRGSLQDFVGFVAVDFAECIREGGSWPFEFQVFSTALPTLDGILNLRIDIPHGLEIDPSCPIALDGKAPISLEIDSVSSETTVFLAKFELPLADTLGRMPFCLRYSCLDAMSCLDERMDDRLDALTVTIPRPGDGSCATGPNGWVCEMLLHSRASITRDTSGDPACAPSSCNGTLVSVVNDCDSMPPNPCFGPTAGQPNSVFRWDFETKRKNYGLRDAQDDRLADAPFSTAEGQTGVRGDRFLVGDTMRVEWRGWVESGGGYAIFPLEIWTEMVQSDMAQFGADAFGVGAGQLDWANFESNLSWLGNRIEVKYADGSSKKCPLDLVGKREDQHYVKFQTVNLNVPNIEIVDELTSLSHEVAVDLEDFFIAGCLTKPTLDAGDTLIFQNDFKLRNNFPDSGLYKKDHPPLLNFRNAMSCASDSQYVWNGRYPFKRSQFSGFLARHRPATAGILPCDFSKNVQPFRYQIKIARNNLFPFEVRELAVFEDFRIKKPHSFTQFDAATLRHWAFQDSLVLQKMGAALPATDLGSHTGIDFSTVHDPTVDEAFSALADFRWRENCAFNRPDSTEQILKMSYPSVFLSASKTDTLRRSLGFFSNTPDLKMAAPLIVYHPTTAFSADLFLKNWAVPPALNAWLRVETASGLLTDAQLFALPSLAPVASAGGIFKLSTIGSFAEKGLRLTAQNSSCATDTLRIIWGWGCETVVDPSVESCKKDTFLIEMRLETPELELEITQQPPAVPLCADSDFFEFEVQNAKFGRAYDLLASIKLPSGLTVAPGSAEISWPVGAPFQPLADPTAVGASFFVWKMNNALPAIAATGLFGVGEAPKNAFRIRFSVRAECGFLANSQPIFGIEGIEPCGRATNILRKTGQPIQLVGLPQPPVAAQISLAPADPSAVLGCGGGQVFEAKILLGSPSASGDSIILTMPEGVSMGVSSYEKGQNAPLGPPIFVGKTARLEMLAGLAAGTVVAFKFSIRYDSTAGCLNKAILAQVRSKAAAVCATTGQPCAVFIAVGEASWQIQTQNPQLTASGFSVEILPTGAAVGTLEVTNVGPFSVPAGTTVWLGRDLDGDGFLGQNEPILGVFEYNSPILQGQKALIVFNWPPSEPLDFCGLLAFFPADANCSCLPISTPLNSSFDVTHPVIELCSGSTAAVGTTSLAGFENAWTVSGGGSVACATCSETTFLLPPTAQTGDIFSLVLTSKKADGTCETRHFFTVVFGIKVEVTASDLTICRGEKAVLAASPTGQTPLAWSWSGPAIVLFQGIQITVQPSATSEYGVTITHTNGCKGSAKIVVEVLPTDSIALPDLTICAGETAIIFGQTVSTAGLFFQKLKKANGCDSTVSQRLFVLPAPATSEKIEVCAGDTALVFGEPKTASGIFSKKFGAANGCDSTHSIELKILPPPAFPAIDTIKIEAGDTAFLVAPNGFLNYSWPAIFGQNVGQTAIFQADSAGFFVFEINFETPDGCPGEAIFRVLVLPPCDAQKVPIPNAFTPDGDGLNEKFEIFDPENQVEIRLFRVFDRWGELVYEGAGAGASWDGTQRKKSALPDAYVYIIELGCPFSDSMAKRVGDVNLIR